MSADRVAEQRIRCLEISLETIDPLEIDSPEAAVTFFESVNNTSNKFRGEIPKLYESEGNKDGWSATPAHDTEEKLRRLLAKRLTNKYSLPQEITEKIVNNLETGLHYYKMWVYTKDLNTKWTGFKNEFELRYWTIKEALKSGSLPERS